MDYLPSGLPAEFGEVLRCPLPMGQGVRLGLHMQPLRFPICALRTSNSLSGKSLSLVVCDSQRGGMTSLVSNSSHDRLEAVLRLWCC